MDGTEFLGVPDKSDSNCIKVSNRQDPAYPVGPYVGKINVQWIFRG